MVRIPTWHEKSDDELRALVRAAWEGRLIGSWRFEWGATMLEQVFPGYRGFEMMAGQEAAGYSVCFATPDAAVSFARAPWPAAAYGVLPAGQHDDPRATGGELPTFPEWEMLSWPEWERLRDLLGYPPRPPRAGA